MKSIFQVFILLFFLPALYAFGQQSLNSSEVLLQLKKIGNTASVLYLAAHPDDENTGLIAYIDNELMARTAYLSLTRGDGGQNLIGSEQGELLGLIRTQELLEARKIDQGEQFFTRAYDFGYSKSPEETFTKWNKDSVLRDVVWVIRKFRPDVIVTRFPDYDYYGHGHHSASAILAGEAFEAAADPNRFPDQLNFVKPWQSTRLLYNSSTWFKPNLEEYYAETGKKYITVDIGIYNPLLGKTYSEISAESRSMHKSQGFGTDPKRGEKIEYLEYRKGQEPSNGILDNINNSWSRFDGGKKVDQKIKKIIKSFNPESPSESLTELISLYDLIESINSQDPLITFKKSELKKLIQSVAGFWIQPYAEKFNVSPGDSLKVILSLINRSGSNIKINKIEYPGFDAGKDLNLELRKGKLSELSTSLFISGDSPYSQPYWLKNPIKDNLFDIPGYKSLGKAEEHARIQSRVWAVINGHDFTFDVPVVYQWADPVAGELFRPVEISPEIALNFSDKSYIFTSGVNKRLSLTVKALKENQSGKVILKVPNGWSVFPSEIDINLEKASEEKVVSVMVIPPDGTVKGKIFTEFRNGNLVNNYGISVITYPHITTQTVLYEASSDLIKIDIARNNEKIGYLPGAGDKVSEVLENMGYNVSILGVEDLAYKDLSRYDVIITGVRAYNTIDELNFLNKKLLEYVKSGGNLIIQYNTNRRLKTKEIGPYPFHISRDRVTVEESPFQILLKEHPIVNIPNKIDSADFENWVQERGLYFPDTWSEKYEAILSFQDPGEDFLDGSLLVTNYGQGTFIYTGISFFRQLPAGVPGAYKLFINMISYDGNK